MVIFESEIESQLVVHSIFLDSKSLALTDFFF